VFVCFKRRRALRLLPLGLVLLALVKIAVPHALGGITSQLNPSNFGVSTVSDRIVRYDAIRPDMWLHLALGQGYGTYSVRVLDNEFLDVLLEGGVLGVVAYVLMAGAVFAAALGPIRRRDPIGGPMGMIAAQVAVAMLVLSATYDLMGFPHGPYIFLSFAGLMAVCLKSPDLNDADPAPQPVEGSWSS
jgi:hypothetical protein